MPPLETARALEICSGCSKSTFVGMQADFQSVLDYAVQRGWLEEVKQNGKDYRLTDAGFAAAQSAD